MSAPNNDYDPVQVAPLDADHVEAMVAAAFAAFAAATTPAELKQARLAHAAERSPIALANREIGALPPQARKEAGARVGQARARIAAALSAREAEIVEAEMARILVEERVDVTLPVQTVPPGAVHPTTALMYLMEDVFVAMGWEVAEGPELEAEWLNFDALNFIPDHPARTMQDTLFVEPEDGGMVLRTHTSPVQVRTMLTREPPIYVVCPGRVYRADEYDATHLPVFHQIEGLVVDRGITLGHLRGTLDHFARAMFGHDADPDEAQLLSLHRAVGRGRPGVLRLPRRLRRQPRSSVPDLQERGLDRVGRLRGGQPPGAAGLRCRQRGVLRVRVRHGDRPHPDVPQQRRGHARHDRG